VATLRVRKESTSCQHLPQALNFARSSPARLSGAIHRLLSVCESFCVAPRFERLSGLEADRELMVLF
jgi:hypothetical protein